MHAQTGGSDNLAATRRLETNCEPQELECGCTKHPGSLYLYLPIHGSMPGHAEPSVAPATDLAGYVDEDAEDFAQQQK